MKNINLDDYPLAKKFLEENNFTINDIDKAIQKKLLELNKLGE